MWDNRIGGTVTNGVLLAWKLNILREHQSPVTPDCAVASCGTLASNEVPTSWSRPALRHESTNLIVASANVDLIFNQFGLPSERCPRTPSLRPT